MNKEFLENVLMNEIYCWLHHNPDDRELKTIMEYVDDCVIEETAKKKRIDLTLLSIMIADAVHDKFMECEKCSERFLPDDMNPGGHFCLDCKHGYDPDGMPGGWDDLKIERGEQN